jgi:hypothetical protein
VVSSPIGGSVFDYVTERQLGGPANASLDAAARTQAIADLQKWEVASCATIIDFENAAVLSGTVTGHLIRGTERQSKIDACTAEANSRPMK